MERTHSADVLAALAGLDEDKGRLVRITTDMWQADNAAVYTLDLLANGAIHRSQATIRGFRAMVREFNMLCAGALLRMQLDTAMRFHAAYLAPQAFDFAQEVLSGTEVYKLRDRAGRPMRDALLVQSLTKSYPWVERIYKQASGYVHLSDIHAVTTYTRADREASVVSVAITGEDGEYPDKVYLDTIATFRAAVDIFADHLAGWIVLKQGQPTAVRASLTVPEDGDCRSCDAYLDIGRP